MTDEYYTVRELEYELMQIAVPDNDKEV